MIKSILTAIFGEKNRVNNHEVLFGHQCAEYGEHGTIVGTWLKEGNRQETTISFYFKGMMLPPRIDEEVLKELFHHARSAGIVPTHLYSYGNMAAIRPAPPHMRLVVPVK